MPHVPGKVSSDVCGDPDDIALGHPKGRQHPGDEAGWAP